uniref:Uncharacterized protein n=1 Tax=Phlebotomus papatasi TaxID=29031 RepID=A0A1B0DKB5_PHLPP
MSVVNKQEKISKDWKIPSRRNFRPFTICVNYSCKISRHVSRNQSPRKTMRMMEDHWLRSRRSPSWRIIWSN